MQEVHFDKRHGYGGIHLAILSIIIHSARPGEVEKKSDVPGGTL